MGSGEQVVDGFSFGLCIICGEYDLLNRHECPPSFLVWEFDPTETNAGEEDCVVVYAYSPERAAEKYCTEEVYKSSEWIDFFEVCVKEAGGDIHKFEMNGEMVPEFTASEVTRFEQEVKDA